MCFISKSIVRSKVEWIEERKKHMKKCGRLFTEVSTDDEDPEHAVRIGGSPTCQTPPQRTTGTTRMARGVGVLPKDVEQQATGTQVLGKERNGSNCASPMSDRLLSMFPQASYRADCKSRKREREEALAGEEEMMAMEEEEVSVVWVGMGRGW